MPPLILAFAPILRPEDSLRVPLAGRHGTHAPIPMHMLKRRRHEGTSRGDCEGNCR